MKYLGKSDGKIQQVGYYLYLHIYPSILTLGIFFLLTDASGPVTPFFLIGEIRGCKLIFIQAKENNQEMEISPVQIIIHSKSNYQRSGYCLLFSIKCPITFFHCHGLLKVGSFTLIQNCTQYIIPETAILTCGLRNVIH